jgi:glucokinase
MFLAGDVGGTKVNLALGHFEDGPCSFVKEASFPSAEHAGLGEIVRTFLSNCPDRIERACFGIAGPVKHRKVQATNLPWRIDADELEHGLNLGHVDLLNDLEANAYGVFALQDKDLLTLQEGEPGVEGNAAVISAGTGLGEAGLYWDGKRHHPFASEGGHAEFGPRTDEDVALWRFVKKICPSVGWEEVLSGKSFMRLYHFLLEQTGTQPPGWLSDEMESGLPAAAVTRAGNENRCPICRRTNQLFLHLYALEAANVAQKFLAVGGVYLGGGLIPKLLPSLDVEAFRADFRGEGPLADLLETIPVKVILNDKAALLGAAWYAENVG